MTIEELKAEKMNLQSLIFSEIGKFEEKTGCIIESAIYETKFEKILGHEAVRVWNSMEIKIKL